MSFAEENYKSWVGPAGRYDLVSAIQFNLLTLLGLRDSHFVLDVGCDSLRLGRLLIPFLRSGHYFGIEPERWAVAAGFQYELGCDAIKLKSPKFSDVADFELGVFKRKFDFIMAQSIFSHASREQVERCINQAAGAMHDSSVFIFNYSIGPKNHDGGWIYPGCVRYTRAWMRHVTENAGLVYDEIQLNNSPAWQIWVVAGRQYGGDDG